MRSMLSLCADVPDSSFSSFASDPKALLESMRVDVPLSLVGHESLWVVCVR